MDIEWAIPGTDGAAHFAILQARPITALPPEPAIALEWPLLEPGGKYARASIIELLPEPLTPLFATLGVRAINRAYRRFARVYFGASHVVPDPMVVLINDYAYYTYEARYADIVPDQRIVYSYEMYQDGTRISVSIGTVELEPDGDATRLIYTEQGAFLDGLDSPTEREHGTGELLDGLAAVLQRAPATT